MKGLILLLSFMTRIPVPKIEYDEEKLGKAMKFFPIVGAIIGLISLLIYKLVLNIFYSSEIAVIAVIITEIIITGGIHLDGLADTFDGIFSYRSKQKMLDIMKDSRIGTNGVLSLIIYFLLKYVLLIYLTVNNLIGYDPRQITFYILILPIISRFCSVISCASAPYARASGMGKAFVDNMKFSGVLIAFFTTIIFYIIYGYLIFVNGFNAMGYLLFFANIILFIFMLFCMASLSYIFSKLITRKIGGITGDTLGALLCISELIFIVIMVILCYRIATPILSIVAYVFGAGI